MYKKLTNIITAKIWIIHTVVYYLIFGLIFQSLQLWYNEWPIDFEFIGKVILSPFGGVFGIYDGFPLYVILPISIHLLFIKFSKFNIFYSYIISVTIAYVIIKYFIYLFDEYNFTIILSSNKKDDDLEVNLLFSILPALITSGAFVHLFLRKYFNK